MSRASYAHEFVIAFPDQLAEGILYVSVEFGTAAHRCFCGCGQEVYTRFSPRDWAMTFDGESVSLWPSIGNWSFPCQSHYILKKGRVQWADQWSRDKIEWGRAADRDRKARHYGTESTAQNAPSPAPPRKKGILAGLADWLLGR
jgi:hypothetical protein